MSNLIPTKMTKDEFLGILKNMIEAITEDDSFEGNFEYSFIGAWYDDLGPTEVEVRGVYRIGNRDGQGGVIMIGTVRDQGETSHDC